MSKYKAEQHITLDSKEFLKEAEKVKKANEEMGKSAEQASSNASEKVDKYTQKLNKLTETLEQLKKEQKKYEEGSTQFNYYSKEIEKATNALDKHIGKTVELKKSLEEVKKAEETETTPRWLAHVRYLNDVIEALEKERGELEANKEAYDWYTKEIDRAFASVEKWVNGWNNTQYENELSNLLNTFERLVIEQEKLKDVNGAWEYYEKAISSVSNRVDELQAKFFDLNETTNEYFDSPTIKENLLNDLFKLDEYSLKIEKLETDWDNLVASQKKFEEGSVGFKYYDDALSNVLEKFETLVYGAKELDEVIKVDEYTLKVEKLKEKIAELEDARAHSTSASQLNYYLKEIENVSAEYDKLIGKTKEVDKNSSLSFESVRTSIKKVADAIGEAIKALDEYSQYALESQKSSISLLIAIDNAGEQLSKSATEYLSLADKLSKSTLFQDKQIEKAEALLIATQNLDDELIERALKVAMDLSTMMGRELPSSATALSRALTNPTSATFAFGMAGIRLSEATTEVAKSLMDEGRQAEAVELMIKELEDRYGGLSEAMSKLPSSKMTQMKNDLLDIKEALGTIFTDYLSGILDLANRIMDRVRDDFKDLANKSRAKEAYDMAFNGTSADVLKNLFTPEQLQMAYDDMSGDRSRAWANTPKGADKVDFYNSPLMELAKALDENTNSLDENTKEEEESVDPYTKELLSLIEKQSEAKNNYDRTSTEEFIAEFGEGASLFYKKIYDTATEELHNLKTYGDKNYKQSTPSSIKQDANSYEYMMNDLLSELEIAQTELRDVLSDTSASTGAIIHARERVSNIMQQIDFLKLYGDPNYKVERESSGISLKLNGLSPLPQFSKNQYVFDGTSFKPMLTPQFDADIPTLTGKSYNDFLKNIADGWVAKFEEEEKKQEELTEEERRLYNLLKDSQIASIKDLESQYKNGSKDMQYWDKQAFAREIFADLDISGLVGEAYREYLEAWGRIVEDIDKSEEEWNAELKEARLKRMHEMNDALLKEREKGLKQMAEMEEASLKKSLDSFIENFGGEHEDPFIGYSESIDMMTGAMSSFYNTIRNGQGVLEAFKNAFFRVVDQIIEKLIALLAVEAISSIFGLDGAAIANASAYTMNAGKVMKTSLSSSLSNMYKSNMFSFAPAKYMKEGQGVKNVIFNIDGFVSSNEADFTRRVKETMNTGEFLVNIT